MKLNDGNIFSNEGSHKEVKFRVAFLALFMITGIIGLMMFFMVPIAGIVMFPIGTIGALVMSNKWRGK